MITSTYIHGYTYILFISSVPTASDPVLQVYKQRVIWLTRGPLASWNTLGCMVIKVSGDNWACVVCTASLLGGQVTTRHMWLGELEPG